METLDALRLKKARELAWNSGNKAAMLRWLSKEVSRASAVPAEFKSGYLAQCRAMLGKYGGALEYRTLNPHWEVQPRVPRGNPDGGQWTQLAGDVPTPDSDKPPSIPNERPERGRDRNRAAKEAARWGKATGRIAAIVRILRETPWGKEIEGMVTSYWDPPKSFEELQEAAKIRPPGYDRHHVVEEASAEKFGFPRSMIDAEENLVGVPRLKHWEINSWFETRNEVFGNETPREYLKDKDWAERKKVGRKVLIEYGILKP